MYNRTVLKCKSLHGQILLPHDQVFSATYMEIMDRMSAKWELSSARPRPARKLSMTKQAKESDIHIGITVLSKGSFEEIGSMDRTLTEMNVFIVPADAGDTKWESMP